MEKRLEREKEFHNNRFNKETREAAWKFYSIESISNSYFENKIYKSFKDKRVLEIGCGKGDFSMKMAKEQVNVVGIDISEVAIDYLKKYIKKNNLEKYTDFKVMNAEELNFDKSYFDGIIGISILHHLKLEKVCKQMVNILKENGQGIFKEPLGHNPFINLYRKLTPSYRTEDEHPLLKKDIEIIKKYFNTVEIKHFHLTTLLAVPFRKTKVFNSFISLLSSVDEFLFKFNVFKFMSWQIIITVSNPQK